MYFCVGPQTVDLYILVMFLRKYEYPKKAPPSFYQVTNNSKERPDVWIDSPEKLAFLYCLLVYRLFLAKPTLYS